jgi:hypothetical protein
VSLDQPIEVAFANSVVSFDGEDEGVRTEVASLIAKVRQAAPGIQGRKLPEIVTTHPAPATDGAAGSAPGPLRQVGVQVTEEGQNKASEYGRGECA